MKTTSILIGSCLFAMCACTKDEGPGKKASEPTLKTEAQNPASEPMPDDPGATKPSPVASDSSGLVAASNALAMDLYRVNRDEPGNLVFSPASISLAFAMTYAGAAGATAEEMRKVLHLPEGELGGAAKSLMADWNPEGAAYELKVVNRLFGEKSYTFEAPYLSEIKSSYGAPLEPLDFAGAAEPQRKHINSWVAEQTEGKIEDLLPPTSIKADTRLVLVNAIYFLGSWSEAFDPKATKAMAFWKGGTKRIEVPTMSHLESHRYAEVEGAKLLELAYKDSPLAMTLILPNNVKGLAELEAKLSVETMESWISALSSERVFVQLPRFELSNARIPLTDSLTKLGMKLAFDRDKADFSTMANPPSPADKLFISAAFHEAFVKVDETGTEAAAATAVVMARVGSAAPAAPKEFHADHPFLFVIRDTSSGAILFLGRVQDPS